MTAALTIRFYEPILVLVIGYLILRLVSPILGIYLLGCSVALFIKGLIVHNRMLNMKRDQIDARIMNQWISSIHKTANAQQQAEQRFFVVQVAEVPVIKREEHDAGETATLPEKQPAAATSVVAEGYFSFNCEKCDTPFQVRRKYSGKKGKCTKCGAVMVVAAA